MGPHRPPYQVKDHIWAIGKIAWDLVPDNVKNGDASMNIDSLDALFDVDVTDFFSFPENENIMDKKDSTKIILETRRNMRPMNFSDLVYKIPLGFKRLKETRRDIKRL